MRGKGILIAVTLVLMCTVFCIPDYRDMASYVWNSVSEPVVVLDPGHGGMDGGAVSGDGTSEKDINLAIARKMKARLESEGIRVIVTRDGDKGLYEETGNESIRSLKTQDMKERKRIIEDSGADLTVSVHLNSFTQDTSVKERRSFTLYTEIRRQ